MNRKSQRHAVNAERNPLWPGILWLLPIALVYFLAARISLLLTFNRKGSLPSGRQRGSFSQPCCLPARKCGPHLVALLFLTDLAAGILAGTPLALSLAYSTIVSGEAVLSTWLISRFVGLPFTLRSARQVFGYFNLVILFSNGLSATCAAISANLILRTSFWSSWFWWFSSGGVGNLLFTPLILTWAFELKQHFKAIPNKG